MNPVDTAEIVVASVERLTDLQATKGVSKRETMKALITFHWTMNHS